MRCMGTMLAAVLLGTLTPNGLSAAQTEKPTLTWLSIDWQPAWIDEGPLKGDGYA